jgi:hypothetical protein
MFSQFVGPGRFSTRRMRRARRRSSRIALSSVSKPCGVAVPVVAGALSVGGSKSTPPAFLGRGVVRAPLFRIDAVEIDRSPAYVTRYALKSLERGRFDPVQMILLPRSVSELSRPSHRRSA